MKRIHQTLAILTIFIVIFYAVEQLRPIEKVFEAYFLSGN